MTDYAVVLSGLYREYEHIYEVLGIHDCGRLNADGMRWIGEELGGRPRQAIIEDICAILGVPVPPELQPAPPDAGDLTPHIIGRLRPEGRALVGDQGERFAWRGLTAFRLLEFVAHGREAEASAFVEWAAARGFTLLRVLGMAHVLFGLDWQDGVNALGTLATLARERGLYLEVTVLADTQDRRGGTPQWPAMGSGECRAALNAYADAARAAGNVVLEGANEALEAHPTQRADIAAIVQGWRPTTVAYAEGSTHADQDESIDLSAGDYVTVHLDRSRDRWNRERRVRELENLSAGRGRCVVSDEPIGADAEVKPGSRDNEPEVFLCQGVLSRLMRTGATFHCTAGLQAQIPTGREAECAQAFIRGCGLIPLDFWGEFKNSNVNGGWNDSPVGAHDLNACLRAYSAIQGGRGYTVALGLTGDPGIRWQGGWTPQRVLYDGREITVFEVAT